MNPFPLSSRVRAFLTLSCLVSAHPALASGFALKEQGIGGIGNAYAGAAAVAEDPSTMFFNPAGMAKLRGNQVLGGAAYIAPEVRFTNTGSTTRGGVAIGGPNGGDAGQNSVVPHFYAMWEANPDLKLGLALTSPYGLATGYDDNWVGRYHAITSKLATASIQPTIAYRLNDKLSVGAGLQFQYMEATLTNAIDFAGLCLGFVAIFGCTLINLMSPLTDGHLRVTANDWGHGYTLGALFEPTTSTRIGLGFRSSVAHALRGEADSTVTGSAVFLTGGGSRFRDTTVETKLTTPESLSLSVVHDLDPKWSLLGDVTWSNWSRFKELRFRYGNTAQADTVTPANWKDSYFFSVGTAYRHSDAWTLRIGLAYDQTPIRDTDSRTARIPDYDRLWIALGASYAVSSAIKIDIGYTHIFVNDAGIDNADPTIPATTGFGPLIHRQRGFYGNQTDILGIGVSVKF